MKAWRDALRFPALRFVSRPGGMKSRLRGGEGNERRDSIPPYEPQ
ncbi:hypothetical protein AZOA_13280 [Azoarcus sp. Aa7]|nr:hypothetical protein [Azoarcus sp. Aa7]